MDCGDILKKYQDHEVNMVKENIKDTQKIIEDINIQIKKDRLKFKELMVLRDKNAKEHYLRSQTMKRVKFEE